METFETVADYLGIFACEIRPCGQNLDAPTGAHFTIADRDWTLSVQWNSGSYSGIGRGTGDQTFEAALWDNGIEADMCENWIAMTPDRSMGFGIEPMAYATLAEIASAMLARLIEGPIARVVPVEDDVIEDDAPCMCATLDCGAIPCVTSELF